MSPSNAQEIWVSTTQPRCQGIGASLRRRWRWVTMFGLAALALGATIAARTEPQYSARARIRLLSEHSPWQVSDSRGSTDDVATLRTQYYVLHSLRILLPVAERLNLAQRWDTDLRGATNRLMEMVTPRKMLDANVTELKVTANDGQLAADIANAIVDVYSTEANQPRTVQAKLTLARLSRECDEQSRKLAETEQQVNDLQRQTGLDMSHGEVSVASLNPLRQMLIQAEGAVIEAQIRVESLMHASRDPLMALETADQSDQISRRVAARMIETEGRVDELSRRYGDDHPIMRNARKQLDEARSASSEQVIRLIEMAKTDQQAAESKAAFAWQRLAEAEQTLTKAGGNYGQLLVATQRQDVQRNLQKLLLDRMQKMQVDMNLAGPAAELIEPAMAPSVPELGTPLQIILIALGIGLGAGIGAAVAVDRLDRTIRGPEEVEWQLNMPLMGTISRRKTMEDFRMVRNSIDFADHTLRTLCVVGADLREGASVTAVNLGRAWAEHGARVLLIDGNLKSPSLHKLLGVTNEAGLNDYLFRQRPLDEVVIHTSMPNVSVLVAGKVTGSKAPALTPQQVSEVLLWARSNADIIIFDAPPVLTNSDSSILARQSDGTVLVARQGGSSVWDLRRAIHVLNGTGEGLMGVVLTAVPSGASWDPMPLEDIQEQQTAQSRTATARLRKRNRNAA